MNKYLQYLQYTKYLQDEHRNTSGSSDPDYPIPGYSTNYMLGNSNDVVALKLSYGNIISNQHTLVYLWRDIQNIFKESGKSIRTIINLKEISQSPIQIKPNDRNNKGLINGLGNVIKIITDNFGNADAEKQDQAINDKVKLTRNLYGNE